MNVPSFMVRVDSQKHIDFALNSPFGGGRPGRNKRKAQKCACLQFPTYAFTSGMCLRSCSNFIGSAYLCLCLVHHAVEAAG